MLLGRSVPAATRASHFLSRGLHSAGVLINQSWNSTSALCICTWEEGWPCGDFSHSVITCETLTTILCRYVQHIEIPLLGCKISLIITVFSLADNSQSHYLACRTLDLPQRSIYVKCLKKPFVYHWSRENRHLHCIT